MLCYGMESMVEATVSGPPLRRQGTEAVGEGGVGLGMGEDEQAAGEARRPENRCRTEGLGSSGLAAGASMEGGMGACLQGK